MLQGSPAARTPRAPSAGSLCRLASSRRDRLPHRGKCPAFGLSKTGRSAPVPKMGTGRGGCTPSLPEVPASFLLAASLLASPAEAARPAELPTAPESPAPQPQPPAALTLARARAGGGRVPAAHRAAVRGSRARKLAAADPGGVDGGGGRRAPSGRPAGNALGGGARGDRPLQLPTGANLGAAGLGGPGRKPPGNPRPRPARLWDPAGPTRHLGNRGAGQSAASCGLPGWALVVVKRGREFKVGLGRGRGRGAGPVRAGG